MKQLADSHNATVYEIQVSEEYHFLLGCELHPCWMCGIDRKDAVRPHRTGSWTSFIRHTDHDGQFELFRLVCGHTSSGFMEPPPPRHLPWPDATHLDLVTLDLNLVLHY